MTDKHEFKPGDLCVAATFPLQHLWHVGTIVSVTEHGTHHVDCHNPASGRHPSLDQYRLQPHEVKPIPEGAKPGDEVRGDLFKKDTVAHFSMTVVPEHRIWTEKS